LKNGENQQFNDHRIQETRFYSIRHLEKCLSGSVMKHDAPDLDLNQEVYAWCARIFARVHSLLKIHLKMHHGAGLINSGDIFLFNHFSRIETFIPQYLIYRETGAFCRSVAAADFFKNNDSFAQLLCDVGAVPNDHHRLLPLMAENIMRGRKVVVFPEGGMVKDRRVIDEFGEYQIYSRDARARRKHHTGAARLATGLQIFKQAVLQQDRLGNRSQLDDWARLIGMDSSGELIEQSHRPVTIVPANITFYPLRVTENLLIKGAKLLSKNMSARAIEELIVESNLVLKKTDMDIRLGEPIRLHEEWRWWESSLAGHLARRTGELDDVLEFGRAGGRMHERLCTTGLRTSVNRLRDRYMEEIYHLVTVNLSHIASHVILSSLEKGHDCLPEGLFRKSLYVGLKKLQTDRSIYLHRNLRNPDNYARLLFESTEQLTQFFSTATTAGLVEVRDNTVCFLDKLTQEHTFDEIRLENPIEVYANEVSPISSLVNEVGTALELASELSSQDLALLRFDDERLSLKWDRSEYSQQRHEEINLQETATADPDPFLFVSPQSNRTGVVLVHGFLASPAEVREFGEILHSEGYNVIGVRLRGHGTSPWDLRDRCWEDWMQSVISGYQVMRQFSEQISLVGFSTGGGLSLALAAEKPKGLCGVAAVSTPIKYRNNNMRFVPLIHGTDRIVRWLSTYEGIMPFQPHPGEHPQINYNNMPIRGLYELTRLNDHLQEVSKRIHCPVTLIQATDDPVVDPDSENLLYEMLGTRDKQQHWIESNRHGILNEDIGDTWRHILDFLARLEKTERADEKLEVEP
jgi:esterase/lipase